jgi:ubiquinone/menaquinone biosynthesis C-methylase UbiE
MRRVPAIELLDNDLGSPADIQLQLDDLWRINRWLGGLSSSRNMLLRFLRDTGRRSVRVLEVGAGDGRLAARLRSMLRERGIRADFFVLDRRHRHLLFGRPASDLHPVVADALALPFRRESFDVVTCNLLLHHFSGGDALRFLCSLGAAARDAVLINDLERCWLPYFFIRAAPWFTRNRMSRHDAVASVRQAYTRRELAQLAAAAGFTDFEVRRLAPFRLGLVLRKSGQASGHLPKAPRIPAGVSAAEPR